jgi:hypothetical protein
MNTKLAACEYIWEEESSCRLYIIRTGLTAEKTWFVKVYCVGFKGTTKGEMGLFSQYEMVTLERKNQ